MWLVFSSSHSGHELNYFSTNDYAVEFAINKLSNYYGITSQIMIDRLRKHDYVHWEPIPLIMFCFILIEEIPIKPEK